MLLPCEIPFGQPAVRSAALCESGGDLRVTLESLGEPSDTAQVTQAALRGVGVVAFRGLALRGLAFAGSLVLARLLTPTDFGMIAVGAGIALVGTLLTDGGLGAALIGRRDPPSRPELAALQAFQLTMA